MRNLVIWILAVAFAACNTKQKTGEKGTGTNGQPETMEDSTVAEKKVSAYNPESALYVWKSSYDYTKSKNPSLSPLILNADSLVKGLNELNENILLEKLKISGDTIYTEIKNGTHLAEEIGTTGAEMYVADVVLNLTEVPGIKYVTINITEGSHMQPGTWSRENFIKYKTVKPKLK
jgi:hypothetical protein